ncbi:MAG: type sorting protein, partial [Bacteroidota bacterium]|nr:type sorting protein [Bacteroidota bacterium]
FSSYLGGGGDDIARGIKADSAGNIFICGETKSTNFPTTSGAYQRNFAGTCDIFVTKISGTTKTPSYSTYIGGSDWDYAYAIAIDRLGNAFVAGGTYSTNFPTVQPYQSAYGGGRSDCFTLKLSPLGNSLLQSSYLGGSGDDEAYSIAVDNDSYCYVTGITGSINFPVQNAYSTNRIGGADCFVTKVHQNGSSLVFSTYLGGDEWDEGRGIAIDANRYVYVVGTTASIDFPTVNPIHNHGSIQETDIFVTKINPVGNTLTASTYLGGFGDDNGMGIAVDAGSQVYVTGYTNSANFPTANPSQLLNAGQVDGLITKFNAGMNTLLLSTYIGGSTEDYASCIAVNDNESICIGGYTNSQNFPTLNPFQQDFLGTIDGFAVKFNSDGTRFFASYFGGLNDDRCNSISTDSKGIIYVAGSTSSNDFPLNSPFQQNYSGGRSDGFISVIDPRLMYIVNFSDNNICAGSESQVQYRVSDNFDANNIFSVQLSDSSGSFANPSVIGSISSNRDSIIPIKYPAAVSGGKYRIRIAGTNPPAVGTPNDNDINIKRAPNAVIIGDTSFCEGETLKYSALSDANSTISWTVSGGSIQGSGNTKDINVKWGNSGTGSITLSQTDTQTGCSVQVTSSCKINSLPQPIIQGNKSICVPSIEVYQTTATEGISNNWSVTGGTIVGLKNGNSIQVIWQSTGIDTVILFQTIIETGCKDSTFIIVDVNRSPLSGFTGDTLVCTGETIQYKTTFEQDVNYKWTVEGGKLSSADNSDSVRVLWDSPGIGKVSLEKISNNSGCRVTDEFDIYVLPNPKPKISGYSLVIEGSIQNYTTSTQEKQNFWKVTGGSISGSSTGKNIQVQWASSGKGKLTLIQINAAGCIDSAFFEVTIFPKDEGLNISGMT